MRIVVAITGASGVQYGIRLLEVLKTYSEVESYLIISENAKQIIELESNEKLREIRKLADHSYDAGDLAAPVASGSAA